MVEEWKDIKGYKGIYKISDSGKGGKSAHFIPDPDNLPFVNHIDENKLSNSINNPEWCTQAYNTNYGEGIKRRVQSRLLGGEDRHPIIVSDELSGIETTYPTIRDCIKSLHITAGTIYKYIDTGISYRNKKFNYYE